MLKSPITALDDSDYLHLEVDGCTPEIEDLWLDADDIRLECGVITAYEASLDSPWEEKAWH